MKTDTLFLAWQDRREESRLWFPVGRLDVCPESRLYRFRYIRGAERARVEAGFPLLAEFPNLGEDYRSPELFPLFQNRIMNRARPEFTDYLSGLGLLEGADPVEILAVSGGTRVTDAYEVFPKLVKRENGSFTCRFFLHGWRHVNPSALERIDSMTEADELYLTLELTNPATGLAIQLQTTDYHMIGWTPRYLVTDLVAAMAESPTYSARVVRVNPLPAPSKQRVLIEMTGCWNQHEPMTSEDYTPMV